MDRWHYPNGTVRVRQRERLGAEAASSTAAATGTTVCPQGDHSTTSPSSSACSSTSAVDRVTLYGRQKNGSTLDDTSTTVGDTEPASSNSSSSSSPAVTVGFWANGVWHPRARTPAEERSHRGGSGPKRTQRRQDRVQQYLAGDWRPAWLEKYIQDKKSREEAREAEAVQAAAQPDPSPTASTDPDPWSGQWQDSWWSNWRWSSSWDGWETSSWTSTTTTSPAAGQELGLPSDGLLPEVHDVDPQELAEIVWTMQLTESERALLVDAGTPEAVVNRISDLFERLEDHDSLERGPEARWALGRLVRRMDEAIENQGVILQVMLRRLQIRGRWPVVRVPAQEMERWRLFTWVRQFGGIFSDTVEHHLHVPLQPREDENMLEAPLPVQTSAQSSHPEPPQLATGEGNHTASSQQGMASPASSSSSSTPAPRTRSRTPPPGFEVEALGLQRALQGELLGIWREPRDEDDDPGAVPGGASTETQYTETQNMASTTTTSWGIFTTSSTTSTTVNLTSTSTWSSSPASSSTSGVTLGTSALLAYGPLLAISSPSSSSSSTSTTWTWAWTWSTTSTTTSSSVATAWPTEIVREAVVQEMQLATEADAIEVAHRLLARTRLLVRNQRLLIVALEETLAWMQAPANAAPLNGATMDNHIWRTVAREAATGDDRPSSATSSAPFAPPAVLLQPGLPQTWAEVVQAVPGLRARSVVGLRRRVWRGHTAEVLRRSHPADIASMNQSANPLAPDDCELYLMQADPNRAVDPNFGGSLPALPGRAGHQARRRHRVVRVPPPLRDPAWASWSSVPTSSGTPATTPERVRVRSRSRDVSRRDVTRDGDV